MTFIMSIKNEIRFFLGYFRLKHAHVKVKYSDRIYVGKHVDIKGGSNATIGSNVIIRPYAQLWFSQNAIIGEGTEIGERCRLSVKNSLVIGRKVLFSPNVYLTDADHAYHDISQAVIEQGIVNSNESVNIGDETYIGINSVIVRGITIGMHCIIGANSVVTSNIPDYSVAVGIPAKIIKKYSFKTNAWEKV